MPTPTGYRGIALPWDGTIAGTFHPKSSGQVLTTSIIMIILTDRGERVMLPNFGSGLHLLVFDPMDDDLEQQVRAELEGAIKEWDDRIEITNMDIEQVPEENRIHVRMSIQNIKDPLRNTELLEFDINLATV
jgi:hypothetical protein